MGPGTEQLRDWESQLNKCDTYACRFQHHEGDMDDRFGPLCSGNVADFRHGCAHGRYVVHEIIAAMRNMGFLTPKEETDYYNRTNDREDLNHMDHRIALEILPDAEYRQICKEQVGIIERRSAIVQELLMRVEAAIRSASPQSTEASIGHPLPASS
jgi:hypothetical protein